MLTLQIAAGIVLAYVIIVNQKALLRVLGWSAKALVYAAVMAGIVVGAVALWGVVTDNLHSIMYYTGGAITFALWFAGAAGVTVLWGRLFPKWKERESDDNQVGGQFAVFLFANTMLAFGVLWLISEYTPAGEWVNGLGELSRSKGYADLSTMLLVSLLCNWPWLVLRLLRKREGQLAS